MNDCETCKYANRSKHTRVIRTSNAVITQQGGIVCEHTGKKTMQITDEGIRCSGFCPSEETKKPLYLCDPQKNTACPKGICKGREKPITNPLTYRRYGEKEVIHE